MEWENSQPKYRSDEGCIVAIGEGPKGHEVNDQEIVSIGFGCDRHVLYVEARI